jgi:hypothetical protein
VRVVRGGGPQQPENPLKHEETMKPLENRTTGNGGNAPGAVGCRRAFSGGPSRGKYFVVVRTFTPCAGWFRLLETVNLSARRAAFGDVILLSPACSGLDQFRYHPRAGGVSLHETNGLADAIGGVSSAKGPNTQTAGKAERTETDRIEKKVLALHRGFLRQNPGAKTQPKPTSQERTPTSANYQ